MMRFRVPSKMKKQNRIKFSVLFAAFYEVRVRAILVIKLQCINMYKKYPIYYKHPNDSKVAILRKKKTVADFIINVFISMT